MGDPPADFRAAIVDANGGATLELAGEVDLACVDDLAARLDAVIDTRTGTIAVDLSRVTFLDSSGLKSLVSAHRRLQAEGRRLTVRAPSAAVFRVLQLSGVAAFLGVQGPASHQQPPSCGSWGPRP